MTGRLFLVRPVRPVRPVRLASKGVVRDTTGMADPIDLTPFGFTPTESKMYATLVSFGPGTGYALAQAAGLARVGDRQTAALDQLSAALSSIGAPEGPAIVELESARACWQTLSRDIARANAMVWLCAPPEAYLTLAPILRRAVGAVSDTVLITTAP